MNCNRCSCLDLAHAAILRYTKVRKDLDTHVCDTAVDPAPPTESLSFRADISPHSHLTRSFGSRTPKPFKNKRHHRTATPEQRQIRAHTTAPIFTFGLDPQADRGLLADFVESIKVWAAMYTANLRSLSAEQVQALPDHSAISSLLAFSKSGSSAVEQDLIIQMVAAIRSRFIFTHTIDERAVHHSNHPHANIMEQLVQE